MTRTDTSRRWIHRMLVAGDVEFQTVGGDDDVVTVVYEVDEIDDPSDHAERIGEFISVFAHVLGHPEADTPRLLRGVIPLDEDTGDAETFVWLLRREWVAPMLHGGVYVDDIVDRVLSTFPDAV